MLGLHHACQVNKKIGCAAGMRRAQQRYPRGEKLAAPFLCKNSAKKLADGDQTGLAMAAKQVRKPKTFRLLAGKPKYYTPNMGVHLA